MSWRALEDELRRWRDAGRAPELWWRDDDATAPSPSLHRLVSLSRTVGVPLALAVVPLSARKELFEGLQASVIMHGTDHVNRAAPGEKKTEFAAAEAEDAALARLARARERLERLAGDKLVPVLAPPWNRVKRGLVPRLPECGLHGLSGFGARRAAEPAPGVREVNTHVDVIDWHGTRGFIGEDAALAALLGHLSAGFRNKSDAEPTGLLTHHLVHDEQTWRFVERLFECTRSHGARWVGAVALFPSNR